MWSRRFEQYTLLVFRRGVQSFKHHEAGCKLSVIAISMSHGMLYGSSLWHTDLLHLSQFASLYRITSNRKNLRRLRRLVMQVAFVRPLTFFISLVLWTDGKYKHGEVRPNWISPRVNFEVFNHYPWYVRVSLKSFPWQL